MKAKMKEYHIVYRDNQKRYARVIAKNYKQAKEKFNSNEQGWDDMISRDFSITSHKIERRKNAKLDRERS